MITFVVDGYVGKGKVISSASVGHRWKRQQQPQKNEAIWVEGRHPLPNALGDNGIILNIRYDTEEVKVLYYVSNKTENIPLTSFSGRFNERLDQWILRKIDLNE